MDRENSFQWGIFIFLAAGKLTFWGGGITSNWLASDHPGAYTSMPHPFLAQKTFVILRKRWPNKKLSWGGQLACTCLKEGLYIVLLFVCCVHTSKQTRSSMLSQSLSFGGRQRSLIAMFRASPMLCCSAFMLTVRPLVNPRRLNDLRRHDG